MGGVIFGDFNRNELPKHLLDIKESSVQPWFVALFCSFLQRKVASSRIINTLEKRKYLYTYVCVQVDIYALIHM